MSPESQPNWKQKFEEIQVEIGKATPLTQETSKNAIATVSNWFNNLPIVGKVLIGLFAISMVVSLLQAVFSLVKLLFSLTILGLISYAIYQVVIKSKTQA